jgi:hypothetical protein
MTEYGPAEQHEIEQQAFPGHGPDDEIFHQYTDENGQVVTQYDIAGESIRGSAHEHDTWNAAVTAMIGLAKQRLAVQLPYVHEAVLEFQSSAHGQIAQFVHANTPAQQIGWGPFVETLASAITAVFLPELEAAKIAVDVAGKVFSEGLAVSVEQATEHLSAATEQLTHGVDLLVTDIGIRTQTAVDAANEHVAEFIRDYMKDEQHPTTDFEWVDAMVEWFGYPERTRDTVTVPIVHELNQSFAELLGQVQHELSHPS